MKTYRVKPLIWFDTTSPTHGLYKSHAKTPLSCMECVKLNGQFRFYPRQGVDVVDSLHETMDAAREAAEQWYLSRLMPALEEIL